MAERVLSIVDVVATVRLKKSSIYARVRDGTFPAPIKCGPRAIGWKSSDIEGWINSREYVDAKAVNS